MRSILLTSGLAKRSILNRIDPRVKLICTLAILLTISAATQIRTLLPPTLFLLIMIALSRLPIRYHLKKLLIILPFMLMLGLLFLLSYHLQNTPISITHFFAHPLGQTFLLILIKSTLALMLLYLLMQITVLNDLLWAMRRFRIPRVITTLSNLVYAYIHIFIAETERIIRARNSRSVCKSPYPLHTLAQISASVFLRSFARADQLYKAMLSRGFVGEYPDIHTKKLSFWDALATLITLTIVTGAFWNP